MASLALGLLSVLACNATQREPTGMGSGGGSGMTGTGTDAAAALIGVWRHVDLIQVVDDIQRITTTMQFNADGSCRRTVESFSAVEGFPRITVVDCRYMLTGTKIAISFGGGMPETFSISFAGFSPTQLELDGAIYDRVG